MISHHLRVLFCATTTLTASIVSAAELPLWELGVGAGVMNLPDYRGAKDTRGYAFPFIYPLYRGDFLRVDNEGIRGLLYDSERLELSFSADGSFPVDSDKIEVRDGMSDLAPTVQIGPSLEINLWRETESDQSVSLSFPARAVFAIDSGIDSIGYTLSPRISYSRSIHGFDRKWRMSLTGGFEFGSDEYHDYYYSVEEPFVTNQRPFYDAADGYAGTRFVASIHGRKRNYWISFFARYDRVDGAEFADSPLVLRDDNLTIGAVFAYFIAKSKRTNSSGE